MLPVRDRSAQTARGETIASTTGLFCKSGVQSLTLEIVCSLISCRCHISPLLPTFNDIVFTDYRQTRRPFPSYGTVDTPIGSLKWSELLTSLLQKIKQLVERLRRLLLRRLLKVDGVQLKFTCHSDSTLRGRTGATTEAHKNNLIDCRRIQGTLELEKTLQGRRKPAEEKDVT
ncbi:hypothetical protein PAMP_003052 [Pampus punctatissimus]